MAIFDKNVRKTVKNNSINEKKKNSKANQPHNHVSKFQKKLSSHFRDMTSNGRMDGPTDRRRDAGRQPMALGYGLHPVT